MQVTLGEICLFTNGGTPKKSVPEYWTGDIPFITGADIDEENGTITEPRGYITEEAISKSSTNLIPTESILLVTRTGVGKVAIPPYPVCVSQDFTALSFDPKVVHQRYLFHVLRSAKESFVRQARGATIQGITREVVSSFKFDLPTYPEQERIASILDKADEIKKDTQESEELRDVLTHSLFIDIFGDPVINPMNWEEEKIENLCERIFAGGDVPKDSLSKEYTAEYTIPIYSNGKAEKSLYGFTSIPKVDKDSVTVSARGTIGFPVVRKAPFYPIIRLIVAIPNTEKVNLQYLCSAISYLEFGKGGSSIPQLTVPMLKSRTVLVPPIDLQEKFSRIFESLREVPKSTELAENNSLSIAQQIFN